MPSNTELANALRVLSMDAIERANSGHPGAPMGMADIAEVLWNRCLKHNPSNPSWINRDRFVLSNGHGSMLLYSLLHLSGYELTIDDLKSFRQMHSRTPGHPEYGVTPGVETTTGPLGQGLANAVGMAVAEKMLAAQFNRPAHDIIDHRTYVFVGDGCLMEGISHEACSLAGTFALGKLVAFYDNNGISIDGEVSGWFTDDTAKRFRSYGWHVIDGIDGHDSDAIHEAIVEAHRETRRPTLIICKTIIGFGSPNKQGKEECHGAPLGPDEIAATRTTLRWPYSPFEIPLEIRNAWDATKSGNALEADWQAKYENYESAFPQLASELTRRIQGEVPDGFIAKADRYIDQLQDRGLSKSTRQASQDTLNAFGPHLPELVGGSADLAGSNLTIWDGCKGVSANDASGNYIYYGVREFGMSAIMNGIALQGGFVPYGATFLIFMEYARNAVRLACMSKIRSIFVYTHDSIGLGEDGPTHQPVEQLANLRSTPNMMTWRPCDTVESAVAWKEAIIRIDGPSSLIFSRQTLAHQDRTAQQVSDICRGAYILIDPPGDPVAVLIATGSEVQLAMLAARALAGHDIPTRVVSMPSPQRFNIQEPSYRDKVIPPSVRTRVAIEAAHGDYWYKYVGLDGAVVGIDSFGDSAPADRIFEARGFTVENVIATVKAIL